MEIRKKTLSREEWYSDKERSYKYKYHVDDFFEGAIGLITFEGLAQPEEVDSPQGRLCIADNGYKWLELIPKNELWVLTAMIDEQGKLFQFYFDITKENVVADDGNVIFYDAFLDVVARIDSEPLILDRDELDIAYKENVINAQEHSRFIQEADVIVSFFSEKREAIIDRLYQYVNLFN